LKRVRFVPALAAALHCLLPATASAAPFVRPQDTVSLPASEIFRLADEARAGGNPADAETFYRALAQDPDPEIRAEARFRLGMMFSDLGRHRDAALEFRALLDAKPDAQRVRIELARVLALLGDEGAARRELRQVQAGGLPPEVAQVIDQFATALRSRKPWGASVELALVPDSNINRATDAETLDTIIAPLDLSEDARSQAGLGGRAAGQAYFRTPLGKDLALLPRVSGQGEFYRHAQFNDMSGSALLGLEWSPGDERIRPSAGATFRWYGGKLYARTATATVNWQHPLSERAQLEATLTAATTDYRLNDLQDGELWNAELGVERAFDTRSGGGITLSGTRQTARDPGYATTGGGVSLVYWREFGGITGFATAGARMLEGDARIFLFPERRRDWQFNASAGATFRRFRVREFAPLIRVQYERNMSTVGIYDYRRLAATFGVTRAF
jgi:tetratricopeptide (TPR) repeat protein